MKLTYGLAFLLLLSSGLSGLYANAAQKLKALKTSDEWRSTYKFDRNVYNQMQDQLRIIIETQDLIDMPSLSKDLRTSLSLKQKAALKEIRKMDPYVVKLLLREFGNNYVSQLEDWSKQSLEVRKDIASGLKSRDAALRSAIAQVGLKALPDLIDFYARALRKDASSLARKTKSLLEDVVGEAQVELDKARALHSQIERQEVEAQAETLFEDTTEETAPEPASKTTAVPESELDFLPLEKN